MERKIKVAHVLGRFDVGGVEVWLNHLNKEANVDSDLDFYFVTTRQGSGHLDQQILRNGGVIENIPKSKGFNFYLNFYRWLKSNKIDVVHSHLLNFSGIILAIAYFANVKIRIAHSHSDKSEINKNSSFFRKVYLKITQRLIKIFSTSRIGCSYMAGESLFGKDFQVIYNGLDLKDFPIKNSEDHAELLKEFSIDSSKLVIGHVGRFSFPKNHIFILDIVKKIIEKDPNKDFVLLLVGNGELFSEINEYILENNLGEYIKLLGLRNDVPNLMTNLFDLFLFPSLYEGMPISLIETQRAGLKSFISDKIPRDIILLPDFFKVLPINKGAEIWVEDILKFNKNSKIDVDEHLLDKFSIKNCFMELKTIYTN